MNKFVLKNYQIIFAVICCSGQVFAAENSTLNTSMVILENSRISINKEDLETELLKIPKQYQDEVLATRKNLSKILEKILIRKTLASQARLMGVDKEPGVVNQILIENEQILAQEQLRRLVNSVPIPDFTDLAREVYETNKEKYEDQPKVHASHILISDKVRSAEEALELVHKVREQAVAGSKKFDELALEYSEDPSAKSNKGDLGFFEAKRMVKSFADTAFAMNTPGEISEPVKTEFGYHLIQFHESKPRTVHTFEELKDKIIQQQREKFQSEQRKKLLSDILSDPSLKLNEEVADQFLSRKPIAADPKATSAGKP